MLNSTNRQRIRLTYVCEVQTAMTRFCLGLLSLNFLFVICVPQKTGSCQRVAMPHDWPIQLLWTLTVTPTEPLGTVCVRAGFWPSDLSSLLSQEQSTSVIKCYGEWRLFCFYAVILDTLFLLLKWPHHDQHGVYLTSSAQSMPIYASLPLLLPTINNPKCSLME